MQRRTSEDSNVTSDSSLSEFVRRRFTGQVPILGGNVRTGAAELGSAVSSTVSNSQLVSTLTSLNDTLRNIQMFGNYTVGSPITPKAPRPPEPILLADNDPDGHALQDAANLEDSKIKLLLSASYVNPRDINKYFVLISRSRDSLRKKQIAMDGAAMRRQARLHSHPVVPQGEFFLEAVDERLQNLADKFGLANITDEFKSVLLRAITHDSAYQGRETNRGLALIGDHVMKLMFSVHGFKLGIAVSDVAELAQASQTNYALKELSMRIGLHDVLIVGKGVDPTSKSVISTAFEAVIGAVYVIQGMNLTIAAAKFVGLYNGE